MQNMIRYEERKNAGALHRMSGEATYEGKLAEAISIIMRRQLMSTRLWVAFAKQFEWKTDTHDGGWRGEYWGKMMRGAVMVYEYSHDEELYEELENAVRLLLAVPREDGVYSTYACGKDLRKWDVWCRKYVMLGLEFFYGICKDEALKAEILTALRREADELLTKIGNGKMEIYETSDVWDGINSCSVLDPIVRLYTLTKEQKYLDFASYIVENAGGKAEKNCFEIAYKNEIYPHEYPVNKAYELMSCFEGLLGYYLVTGKEKWLTAVTNFVHRICEMEVSVIGCCGNNSEELNGSTKNQCLFVHRFMYETCVTVTWMKLCHMLEKLTGDAALAAEFEKSFYNAMLGAVNFTGSPENGGMVFDSYSPLLFDKRGKGIGGLRDLQFDFCGCCVAIGAAGIGIFGQSVVMENEEGIVWRTYQQGRVLYNGNGRKAELSVDTAYPYGDNVNIKFIKAEGKFSVFLRIPAWCHSASVCVNGEEVLKNPTGYAVLHREWEAGDTVELHLPTEVKAYTLSGHISFSFGSAVLARDIRFDKNAGKPLALSVGTAELPEELNIIEKTEMLSKPEEAQFAVRVRLVDGEELTLINFADAGSTWDERSRYEVWIQGNTMQ